MKRRDNENPGIIFTTIFSLSFVTVVKFVNELIRLYLSNEAKNGMGRNSTSCHSHCNSSSPCLSSIYSANIFRHSACGRVTIPCAVTYLAVHFGARLSAMCTTCRTTASIYMDVWTSRPEFTSHRAFATLELETSKPHREKCYLVRAKMSALLRPDQNWPNDLVISPRPSLTSITSSIFAPRRSRENKRRKNCSDFNGKTNARYLVEIR